MSPFRRRESRERDLLVHAAGGDGHRQREAAAEILADPLYDCRPLVTRELADLRREPQDGYAVRAARDRSLDLPPHESAVERTVSAEEGVEHRIDAMKTRFSH